MRYPATRRILGESLKVTKGLKRGVLTRILYLAPARSSGRNVCAFASPGCAAACLGHSSGRLRLRSSENARLWKTDWYFRDRVGFVERLDHELELLCAEAARKGLRPAVRLNGTSDLPWERLAPRLFERPLQFYDYTKDPARGRAWARGELPGNYHLTFSRSEINGRTARTVLHAGCNVAVVFRERPARFWGAPVIDGDLTDVRFEDPVPCVVGLSPKGALARRDKSGFVV